MALIDELEQVTKINKLVSSETSKTTDMLLNTATAQDNILNGNTPGLIGPIQPIQQDPSNRFDPNFIGPPDPNGPIPNIALPNLEGTTPSLVPQRDVSLVPGLDVGPDPSNPQEPEQGDAPIDFNIQSPEDLTEAIGGFNSRRDTLLESLGGVLGAITQAQFGVNLGHLVAPNYFANRARQSQQLQQAQSFFGSGGAVDKGEQKQGFALDRQSQKSEQDLIRQITTKGQGTEQVFRGTTTETVSTGAGTGSTGERTDGTPLDRIIESQNAITDFIRTDIVPQLPPTGLAGLDQSSRARIFGDATEADINKLTSGNPEDVADLIGRDRIGGSIGQQLSSMLARLEQDINPSGADIGIRLSPEGRENISTQLGDFSKNFPELLNVDLESVPPGDIITTTGPGGENIQVIDPLSETGATLIAQKSSELDAEIERLKTETPSKPTPGRGGLFEPSEIPSLVKRRSEERAATIKDLEAQKANLTKSQQEFGKITQASGQRKENFKAALRGDFANQQLSEDPELARRLGLGGGPKRSISNTQRDVIIRRLASDPEITRNIEFGLKQLRDR